MKPAAWTIFLIVLFLLSVPTWGTDVGDYLDQMNNGRGFIIHVECNTGDLTAGLGANNDNIVQGLDQDIHGAITAGYR
ncbi:MAG: hypothetical protein ACYS74_20895 [Planctomycetota bacterium]|jgi:hypothetical protein